MVQQAPLSMGFSRQEYWSGLPSSKGSSRPQDWTCVSYGSCTAGGFFITEPWGSPYSQVLAVKMQASWGVILPYSCGRILVKIEQMQQINISVAMKLNFLLEKENKSGNRRGLWLRNHRWKANMSSESYRCQVTNEKPVYKTSICSFRMQCSSDLKTVRIFLEEQEKGECYFMAALGTTSEKHGWNCVGRCWNTNLQLHSSPSYSFLTLTPH